MGDVIAISTRREAISYGDQWREYAERMEMLRDLAVVRADMAEMLLRDALQELERIKALVA